jgi:hypothetical protein
VIELDVRARAPAAVCGELASNRATALLLLVGFPEPAVSIVKSVRHDQRLAEIMIGAPARIAQSWPRVAVHGTRGQIQFSRTPGISAWQWAWTPTQVVDRDPAEPGRFRVLHAT